MVKPLQSVPYKGDDFPQTMARLMWLPMLAMGLMAVGIGLVASFVAGIDIADFFGGEGPETLRTGKAIGAWAGGTIFLGMGFILSSITMVLVNIIRTLRDTGRDVQQAVGARQLTQLRKPLAGHAIPHVMMMGLMLVIAAFVVGIVQASLIADVPPAGFADPAQLQGESLADFGAAQATAQWVGPLRLLGLALIFVSIVLALRTIIRAITFQAQRVQELRAERAASAAPASAPTAQPAWEPQPSHRG